MHSGVRCASCHEAIFSRHVHDWRTCKCGGTFVDGGLEYLRYGTLDSDTGTPEIVEQEEG